MPRFSIRTLFAIVAFLARGLGWYVDRTRIRQEQLAELAARKATHHYVLAVEGTPGVQFVMTLVTKPASKKVETITVPYTLKFEANEAEAWLEYLPNGQSGNDGDTYDITLAKDEATTPMHVFAQCNGTIKKDARQTIYVNGDAHWMLGDF
jgi:type II secretory pathway pseudopilin PulG